LFLTRKKIHNKTQRVKPEERRDSKSKTRGEERRGEKPAPTRGC
jgi:hypothetical protein